MWLIYFITIADNLHCISMVLSIISLIGTILTSMASIIDEDSARDSLVIKSRKLSITFLSIFAPIALFVPNSKQAAMIVSVGTTIEYVQNNEKIKELPDKAVLCLDKFIDEYLKEKDNYK
jgi:hypothetical protein